MTPRREFLKTTALGAAALGLGTTARGWSRVARAMP
jgi:anaerobic selenocysteine-containing dehydrogenase